MCQWYAVQPTGAMTATHCAMPFTVFDPRTLHQTLHHCQASDVLAGLLKKAGFPDASGGAWPAGVPTLPQLFYAGQLVRCTAMDLLQVWRLQGALWPLPFCGDPALVVCYQRAEQHRSTEGGHCGAQEVMERYPCTAERLPSSPSDHVAPSCGRKCNMTKSVIGSHVAPPTRATPSLHTGGAVTHLPAEIAIPKISISFCVQGERKRIKLSLHVARLNGAAGGGGLHPGAVLPAAVKAVEDHGYSLTFGIKVRRSINNRLFGTLRYLISMTTQCVGYARAHKGAHCEQ